MKFQFAFTWLLASASTAACAQTYNVDPNHTYPNFEADHAGLSTFHGKFKKTSGSVTLDRAAKTGSVDITIDASSIDIGHAVLNEHLKSAKLFDVEKYPTISYKSQSMVFDGDQPVTVDGALTLHGVTRPVPLTISRFKCVFNSMLKREVCGADAVAQFKRSDFGLNYGVPAFSPDVKISIQIEAIRAE